MKTIFNLLLVIAVVTSQLLAVPPSDSEATTLLVGSWVVPRDQFATVLTKDGCLTFKSDGTFSSYGVFRVHDEDIRVELQGKWSVKDGVLIEELTTSNQPQLAPVGWITRDTLVAVTDKKYRFRTDQKVEYTYVRK